VLLIETAAIPEAAALSYDAGAITYAGQRLDALRCFYLRTLHIGLPSTDPETFSLRNFDIWQEMYIAERERQSLITSVLEILHEGGAHLVNPVGAMQWHAMKLHQLARLKAHDIPVPESLATNDLMALAGFLERHNRVIYKPLAGGATVRRLTYADLEPERLTLLQHCPVLFQEEILGEEYRAYLLDGEPVAAFSIPTGEAVDARLNLDQARPAELSEDIWSMCVRAAKALGMRWTAVDLRREASGRHVIFECNPTPAISFFDDPVDGIVIRRLADYLLAHA
jgi:glutathione synthase/RimK-type ligase-like ATP-grasp enzyme